MNFKNSELFRIRVWHINLEINSAKGMGDNPPSSLKK